MRLCNGLSVFCRISQRGLAEADRGALAEADRAVLAEGSEEPVVWVDHRAALAEGSEEPVVWVDHQVVLADRAAWEVQKAWDKAAVSQGLVQEHPLLGDRVDWGRESDPRDPPQDQKPELRPAKPVPPKARGSPNKCPVPGPGDHSDACSS